MQNDYASPQLETIKIYENSPVPGNTWADSGVPLLPFFFFFFFFKFSTQFYSLYLSAITTCEQRENCTLEENCTFIETRNRERNVQIHAFSILLASHSLLRMDL